jgi:transposase-like protein
MGSKRMPGKPTTRRYSQAEKDQAVRLVRQLQAETGKKHGAIQRVAAQLDYGVESVRTWVKQASIDAGEAPGTTSEDAARIKELEQENRELRRANAILKSASLGSTGQRNGGGLLVLTLGGGDGQAGASGLVGRAEERALGTLARGRVDQ